MLTSGFDILLKRVLAVMPGLMLGLAISSCGTGIEVTEHVTDKDVQKVIQADDGRRGVSTLSPYVDSVASWRPGKQFWVADNQVRQLFGRSRSYNIDTVQLSGRVLSYVGYDTGGLYDNRKTVNLQFSDPTDGKTLSYRTGKTIDEFGPGFTIPMLIDMDYVAHVSRQIAGKDFYIRTPIWYDRTSEQMRDGRHYIKVHIDSVQPGNAVMPLRVLFTAIDSGEQSMVWMSDERSVMYGRDFDAMFVAADPRLSHPAITDAHWELITRGKVETGMTKEECRLAMGNPTRISENPDQRGMREYWYYDGGTYLYFVDGLLNQYRR